MKSISYLRVSTDKQGERGYGLEAQRRAVADFIGADGPIAEFVEVESGKRHDNRPQLAAALAAARKHKARLVIAKLDRLARNVAFIAGLMEEGVEFVCCDMPSATPFMLHIYAADGPAMERQDRRAGAAADRGDDMKRLWMTKTEAVMRAAMSPTAAPVRRIIAVGDHYALEIDGAVVGTITRTEPDRDAWGFRPIGQNPQQYHVPLSHALDDALKWEPT
jgi:hypothetical protein